MGKSAWKQEPMQSFGMVEVKRENEIQSASFQTASVFPE